MAEPVRFQPRFTVAILYFAAFLLFYWLLLAAPDLIDALGSPLAPDAGPEVLGEMVRKALAGRLRLALLAALITLGGLAWARVLPGMRGPEGR